MSVDWGESRFGLAFGSLASSLIIPANFECFTINILEIISQEVLKRQIKLIIIGYPTNFRGGKTSVSKMIDDFIFTLKESHPDIDIETINERCSTKEANKILTKNSDKHKINHQAAAKILEYYFYKRDIK
ncbi:MAG: RuvX/YqgF family protein [Patescibacteria group bacterium]